jgi:hypothetical protein
VVVVSEQRGEVSLVREGKIQPIKDADRLTKILTRLVSTKRSEQSGVWYNLKNMFVHQWPLKLIVTGLVTMCWLFLAGQQDFVVSFEVPVQTQNLPSELRMLEPVKPTVTVTARGLRKDTSTLNDRNVKVQIDMRPAAQGIRTFRIGRSNLSLPNANVDIVSIEPDELTFVFENQNIATPLP